MKPIKVQTKNGMVLSAMRFDQADVFARMGHVGMDLDTGVSFESSTSLPYVLTSAGRKYITNGDWILTAADGETQALSPEEFAELVEPVKAGAQP